MLPISGALVIIAFAVVLFLLVQARFILISLATAIILFSLTSDVINFIARQRIGPFRIPNALASIAAMVLIAAALLTLTSILLAVNLFAFLVVWLAMEIAAPPPPPPTQYRFPLYGCGVVFDGCLADFDVVAN